MHNAITSHYASTEETVAAQCASSKTSITFCYAQFKIYIATYNVNGIIFDFRP
jgi:hypothetical protein